MEEQTGRQCESSIPIEYLMGLREEIHHMVEILEMQGVKILRLDWGEDRTPEEIQDAVTNIAQKIHSHKTPSLFLDLHRRTV
jgi:hypothetical protein